MGALLPQLEEALAGRYELQREIGRGGMATVYLARDLKLGRDVALKVLAPDFVDGVKAERFRREIQTTSRLRHPHIVGIHDSGVGEGLLYFVMPYVSGESVRARLDREKVLPVDEAVMLMREVLDGLGHAHAQGVVHRDIKPENILLEEGHAMVADFGIARLTTQDDLAVLTRAGFAVGTPKYMSPEQAKGSQALDARSDVYAAGVVLYEMLAGVPPYLEPTFARFIAAHESAPIPDVRRLRPDVPPMVADAIRRALAKKPEERWQTAQDFRQALGGSSGSNPYPVVRAPFNWRRRLPLIGGAAVAALAVVGAWTAVASADRPALEPNRFAVLGFERRGPSPVAVSPAQTESLVEQAFAQYREIELADPLAVGDAIARRADRPLTLSERLAVARAVGAANLVTGDLAPSGDSALVRIALYDVRKGRLVRSASLAIGRDLVLASTRVAAAAAELVLSHGDEEGTGSRSLEALQALAEARTAEQGWRLEEAKGHLRRALAADPAFARAKLRLASLQMWTGEPASAWAQLARGSSVGGLSAREARYALALTKLGEGAFGDACPLYEQLVREDSLAFAAWWGLGECQLRDRAVVPDRRSPSGWAFRTSYDRAARAFLRAFELVPSSHHAFETLAFTEFERVNFTTLSRRRPGVALAPDSQRFAAYPMLDGDSVAFVPWPVRAVLDSGRGQPADRDGPLALGRWRRQQLADGWLARFPTSADAHEMAAIVAEEAQRLAPSPRGDGAVDHATQARALATDPAQRARLGVMLVRLDLKLGQYASAARKAAQLLAAADPGDPAEAGPLVAVATLLGQADLAARLAAVGTAAGEPIEFLRSEPTALPPAVAAAAQRALVYAALGGLADSLRASLQGVERVLQQALGDVQRAEARRVLLTEVAVVLVGDREAPVLPARDLEPAFQLDLRDALARGDTSAVRAQIGRLDALRAGAPRVALNPEAAFVEARVLLALGDTTAATGRLDAIVDGSTAASRQLLGTRVAPPAALVRAMLLRSRLAVARGDRVTARRWADAALALRAQADDPLRAEARQVRALAYR